MPAEASHLSVLRRSMTSWLTAAGVDKHTTMAILIASGEACANAIEHAYQFAPATIVPANTFRITATLRGDTLNVVVADTGQWKPIRSAPANLRGRGIQLMNGLMDTVSIERTDHGTTVRLTKRLT